MEEYLIETPSMDYMNYHIQEMVQELKNQSDDNLDYIREVTSLLEMRFLIHGTLKQK